MIGERALEYYPYYFAIWDDEVDHRLTVKKVLAQWAMALTRLESTSEPVWLPYYLDDQDCKYLKAELDGEHVVLTDMYVWADGYAMDLDDLSTEMHTEPDAVESFFDINGDWFDTSPKVVGRFKVRELIEALRDAEIVE